mmetsp:Transcript_32718/g.43069  ORF Transcript_32718/g.43069 Transcript_32718/m.43069 type:complete len:609 (-) Transcript_32718:403-2229(-)
MSKVADRDPEEKLRAPADFKGPEKNRKCTDVLVALLLVAAWAAMTYLGYDAVQNGDLNILTKGMQYDGKLCGVDEGVIDYPYLYYIRTDLTGVCVDACPSETDLFQYVCIDSSAIPEDYEGLSESELVMSGDGFCMYYYKSTPVLGHCVFSDTSVLEAFSSSSYSDVTDLLKAFISDCKVARHTILACGVGLAMVLGFFYLMFVRFPCIMNILVWGSVWIIEALCIGLGYLMYYQANVWTEAGTHSTTSIYALWVGAVIFWVAAFLWICIVCFLRQRIALAEDVVIEATRPVTCMPAMLLWPVIQTVAILLFLIPFFIFLIYTASLGKLVGEVDEETQFTHKTFEYSQELKFRALFLLFELFWTSQFIIALGEIILALSVAQWYFSRNKKQIHSGTFCTAICEAFWYHMGTAAYGGFIVAVIKMIRSFLLWVQAQTKKYNNKVMDAILCCCQCCMMCLEKCVKFINKNAYIQTAIFSTDFCTSCVESFHLICRNIARVGAVSIVQEVVLFIMQAFISLFAAAGCYRICEIYYADELNSLLNPTVMCFIVAWFVATQFKEIYGMAILTILHCFIADEEMFEGDQRFAEHTLYDWLQRFEKKGEKRRLVA